MLSELIQLNEQVDALLVELNVVVGKSARRKLIRKLQRQVRAMGRQKTSGPVAKTVGKMARTTSPATKAAGTFAVTPVVGAPVGAAVGARQVVKNAKWKKRLTAKGAEISGLAAEGELVELADWEPGWQNRDAAHKARVLRNDARAVGLRPSRDQIRRQAAGRKIRRIMRNKKVLGAVTGGVVAGKVASLVHQKRKEVLK